MNSKELGILLDSNTYKKIKEFSKLNNISLSEIIRVLLNKSSIKIDVREVGAVIKDAKEKGKVNKSKILVTITEELIQKIRNMSLKNNASYSEIVRHLISKADFNNISFRTKGEIMSEIKTKKK